MVAGLAFTAALYFAYVEITAVGEMRGVIGPFFALGVLCGSIGGVALSARLFLDDEPAQF